MHPVALLCARDLGGGGVEVEFFGERTTLPGGPATLSLRTGAPLLPTAIYFDGPDLRRGVVLPPIDTTRHGKLRDDVQRRSDEHTSEHQSLMRTPDHCFCMKKKKPRHKT